MLEIGIINYNGGTALAECLLSLVQQDLPIQIHVWDNASTDQSAQKIAPQFPQVKFHFGTENLGYAFACNRLAELMNSEYIALSNMDCIYTSNWSRVICDTLKQRPDIGALGSLVLEETSESTTKVNALSVRLYPDLHPTSPEDGLSPEQIATDLFEAFSNYGAIMVFKKSVYEQVGQMDESYFLYYEETDFFWKLQLHNIPVWTQPKAVVRHYRSWSTGQFSFLKLFYSERNRVRSAVKYLPLSYLAKLPWLSVLRLKHSMRHSNRYQNNTQKMPPKSKILFTLFKAWFMGYINPKDWSFRFDMAQKIPNHTQKTLNILQKYKVTE